MEGNTIPNTVLKEINTKEEVKLKMKEINAIKTKKQQHFSRNPRTQMLRTALLKARVNWKYCFIAFVHTFTLKKNEIQCAEKRKLLFPKCQIVIKVAEIIAPLKLMSQKLTLTKINATSINKIFFQIRVNFTKR